jgi:tetratricopeptide (TPR) repeat protein
MNSRQILLSILLGGGINLVAVQPNLLPPLLAQSPVADPKPKVSSRIPLRIYPYGKRYAKALAESFGLASQPRPRRPLGSGNPLERKIDARDPVIPPGYGKRELSSFEIYRIEREIKKLDQNAQAEQQQGNTDKAFELWYRQLKLARAINPEMEITALGNIGAIAWQENRAEDLRNIANRLIGIEQEISLKDSSPKLLKHFAKAYEQVKYLEQAIAIYQQILSNHQQQDNQGAVRENLETLGTLYVAQFNYPEAALTYQELLSLAEPKSSAAPSKRVDFYLNTLIDLYDRTNQIKPAIATRKRLIANYTKSKKLEPVAGLQLAIAHDYAALNQTKKAQVAYEQALELASASQQLAIASNALDSLGKLYLQSGQDQKAIATLTELLKIQQQSYNHYGLINTYDTLGKISLASGQKKSAKDYFQQALNLAQTLNYKVEYFKRQIAQLTAKN